MLLRFRGGVEIAAQCMHMRDQLETLVSHRVGRPCARARLLVLAGLLACPLSVIPFSGPTTAYTHNVVLLGYEPQ